jgi:hypothetical protein
MSSNGAQSTLCGDFLGEHFTFELHMDIEGGTGKYKGATGFAVVVGSGDVVGSEQYGILFKETRTIYLAE